MITDYWKERTLYVFKRWRELGVCGIYICWRNSAMAIGSGNLYFGSAPCNDNASS